MRRLALLALLAACGNDHGTGMMTPPDSGGGVDWSQKQVLPFGPYSLTPGEEVTEDCVQITLNNTEDIYINTIELTTGAGFHHSNWFWVPEGTFPGPSWNGTNSSADDGTFKCTDRHFDQAVAAIYGGVVFAQSTQSQHEVQAFPPGMVIKIPARSKLVANIHLLNPGDTTLQLSPTIALTPLALANVVKQLAGIAFEDHALGLPPNAQSRFTVDACDLVGADQTPPAPWPAPNFKIYYALAHYHAMGTGMTIEAVKSDGSSATVYTTAGKVGDALGGPLDPPFDMTGYSKLRFSCDYYNNTAATVAWGNGGQEMCVFLAFSDASLNYGGGVPLDEPPGTPTDVGGVMTYTHACTSVFANPLN